MKQLLSLLGGLCLLGTLVTPALADDTATTAGQCNNPRAAMYGLLYWLQPERHDPIRAAACMDISGLTEPTRQAPVLAEQLLSLLDARGLRINIDGIPSEADYINDLGQEVYPVRPQDIQGIEIVKSDDKWMFSSATLARIPLLYDATFPPEIRQILETLPDWMHTKAGLTLWQWIGLGLLLVLAWLLRSLLVWTLRLPVKIVGRRSSLPWLKMLLDRADGPLGGLAFALLLGLGHPLLQLPLNLATGLWILERFIGAVAAIWLLFRATDVLAELMSNRAAQTDTKLDDQLVPIVKKTIKVIVGVTGMVFILQNLGVDVTSLLATISIGGVAIALAAKDMVANFFGSAMIFIDRPFQIGDYVMIGAGTSGTIEEVGFRSSLLRTGTGSLITLPNATMTNSKIENLGRRPNRRYDIVLGLTYDTSPEKLQAFCEGCIQVINAHGMTLSDEETGLKKSLVRFVGYGPSSLDVMVRCWFDTLSFDEEQTCKHMLNMEILRLAHALNVSFAFPSQSVYVEQTPESNEPSAPSAPRDALEDIARTFGPGGKETRSERWKL